jgi:hypothetical protein
MSNSDLERKIKLQEQLLEMLEQRIQANETLSSAKTEEIQKQDIEIKRLEEELQRERNRPVQVTQSSGRRSGKINLDDINAAELLFHAEKRGIRWGS